MTLSDSRQAFRLRVLQEATRSGNVTATCERYGISRTLFYRLRGRFQRYGPAGLHPKRPGGRRGRTPELPVADERRVIAEALAWPTRGPQWISDRLARLAVLEEQSAATGLLTERTARRRRGRPVVAAQPGELCALGTFYVGKLKGVGKVWQLTACDCASSYGCAGGGRRGHCGGHGRLSGRHRAVRLSRGWVATAPGTDRQRQGV